MGQGRGQKLLIAATSACVPMVCIALAFHIAAQDQETTGTRDHADRVWPAGWYSISGPQPYSTLWSCHARFLKRGRPVSPDVMAAFAIGDLKPGTSVPTSMVRGAKLDRLEGTASHVWSPTGQSRSKDYAVSYRSAEWPHLGGSTSVISRASEHRVYPADKAASMNAIVRELGAPLSILEQDGFGCAIRSKTIIIYSTNPQDGSGRTNNVAQLCERPSNCSVEPSDPCSDPKQLPSTRILTVAIDNGYHGDDLEKLFPDPRSRRGPLTRVTLSVFDPASARRGNWPIRRPGERPVCERQSTLDIG